jgi:SpoIID/LytB domain protein
MTVAGRALLVVLLALASSTDRAARVSALGQNAIGPSTAPVTSESVRIGVLRNGAYEVVSLPMETYVARVLAGEAAPDSPPAALEALAIAIRTYTVTNRSRHAAEGFDLCDQTHCQVMRNSSAVTERAALSTAEQILRYRGAPATVFYSASCGGRTEKPSNVWPGADDPPYLAVHDDDGCGGFPAWSAELAEPDLERAFHAGGFKGTLRDIRILSRNDSGRVARLVVDGLTPKEITGQDLRMVVGRALGFQHIQSTQFDLRRTGRAFRFTGRGAGHGVGLCVIGSMKLAASGQTAATILARYFPGTQVGPYAPRTTSVVPAPAAGTTGASPVQGGSGAAAATSGSSAAATPRVESPTATAPAVAVPPARAVDIVVPAGETTEKNALTLLVDHERQVVEERLGAPAPRTRLVFHESNLAYERASGRPWFTLGAVTADGVQLAPVWLLRERGMLERTIRRQLVHLVVDPVLTPRPVWIREGASVYYADPDATNGARPPCPLDNELQAPTSIGALGDALARARACFERQISGGRDWRRVR